MSDPESPDALALTLPQRPSKRRRVIDSEASTPEGSSSDELDERDFPAQPLNRSNRAGRPSTNSRRQSGYEDRSTSPDELDHTRYDSPEEGARSGESRGQSRSRSRSRSYEHVHDRRGSSTPSSGHSRSVRSDSALVPEPERQYSVIKPRVINYRLSYILQGHNKGITQVKFSPDGLWIASSSADGKVRIWETKTGRHMNTLYGHLAGINAIAWSPDSQILATGSDDKIIRLWDRVFGQPYKVILKGHHNYVTSLAFSPSGNVLASGSYDEAVFFWDIRSGHQMRSMPAHSDPVGGVDFSRDGTVACSCSTDGLIRIWDTSTGQCLNTLVHEDNAPVTNCQFSTNGNHVVAWTMDGSIRLWDWIEGRCKKTYQGHMNLKFSIGGCFGLHGREASVISGSEDGKIFLWDARTKRILQSFQAHDCVVMWVDVHPSQDILVSGGVDGEVRIWRHHETLEDVGNDTAEVKVEDEQEEEEEEREETMSIHNTRDTPLVDSINSPVAVLN